MAARRKADELRECIKTRDERAAVRHIDSARKSAWIKDEAGTYPIHEAVQEVITTACLSAEPRLQWKCAGMQQNCMLCRYGITIDMVMHCYQGDRARSRMQLGAGFEPLHQPALFT